MYIVFYAVIISFWINLVKKNPLLLSVSSAAGAGNICRIGLVHKNLRFGKESSRLNKADESDTINGKVLRQCTDTVIISRMPCCGITLKMNVSVR